MQEENFAAGDFFEDCSYHPCVCILARPEDDEIRGISLVDGTLHCCSLRHCGIVKLTLEQAISWRLYGPDHDEVPEDRRWWRPGMNPWHA